MSNVIDLDPAVRSRRAFAEQIRSADNIEDAMHFLQGFEDIAFFKGQNAGIKWASEQLRADSEGNNDTPPSAA